VANNHFPSLVLSSESIGSPNPGYLFLAIYPIFLNNLISPFSLPVAIPPA